MRKEYHSRRALCFELRSIHLCLMVCAFGVPAPLNYVLPELFTRIRRSPYRVQCEKRLCLDGPLTHLFVVLIVSRRINKKSDFAGPQMTERGYLRVFQTYYKSTRLTLTVCANEGGHGLALGSGGIPCIYVHFTFYTFNTCRFAFRTSHVR